MRKLTTLINVTVLVAVFFLAGTTSSMAGTKKAKAKVNRIVLIFSGTLQQFPSGTTGTTSGPFTCPSGEELNIATTVFYFWDGICDDSQSNSAGLPACGGRFTSRIESCSSNVKVDGGPFSIVSATNRGQFELCFASAATLTSPADCWNAGGATGTTVGMVYATGTSLGESRLTLGLVGIPAQVNGDITLTSSTKFTDVNGINVDANELNGAISHTTVEPNFEANRPACGFTVTPGSPGFGPGSGRGPGGCFRRGQAVVATRVPAARDHGWGKTRTISDG